jgi:hypothetical protein
MSLKDKCLVFGMIEENNSSVVNQVKKQIKEMQEADKRLSKQYKKLQTSGVKKFAQSP